MAIKMVTYFLQTCGYGIWFWGIVDSFGSFKSVVLLIVGLIFAGIRIQSALIDVKKNNLIMMNIKERKRAA